jgi:predicted membrane-bound mannosyltransferase
VPRRGALVRLAVVQSFAGKAEEERDAEHLATTTTPPAGVWGAARRAERASTRHLAREMWAAWGDRVRVRWVLEQQDRTDRAVQRLVLVRPTGPEGEVVTLTQLLGPTA